MDYSGVPSERRSLNISIQRVVLIAFFLFLNVYSSKIRYLGAILAIAEIIAITLSIIQGKLVRAYNLLILCLSCSLEMASFVYLNGRGHPLYSVFNSPALSIFPFYGVTYLLFVFAYMRYRHNASHYLSVNIENRRFIRFLPLLFISGFFTGLVTLLVNDNGISNYSWSYTALLTNSLRILSLICFIGTGTLLVNGVEYYRDRIGSLIVELLFSYGLVSTITVLLGWHGFYGSITNTMLMPLASSLCPMLIVVPAFYKVKRPIFYYIFAFIFTIESLFYNSLMGSKFYTIPLLSVLIYIIVAMKKGRLKTLIIVAIGLLIAVIHSGSILNLITRTEYGDWKFNQLIRVFDFSGGGILNWYNNVDASPRFRIDEFVNIFLEYVRKPWYALFGKGNAGTILHTWGTTNWYRRNGTFADYQIDSGIFMTMHESINVIFIRHGLVGLVFLISTLKSSLKRFFKSPWALGGIIWLLFYWGIYLTWWIGALMLVLALSDTSNNKADRTTI